MRYLLLVLFLGMMGCAGFKRHKSESPVGYDLNKPVVVKLPTELDEISGLAYYPKDTCIFAIVDEAGLLYKIFLNRPKHIQKWEFAGTADYEDIVLLDSTFYVLSSEGRVVVFRFLTKDTMAFEEFRLPGIRKGDEFEIIYYDSVRGKIKMVCKDCETDNKASLSVYTFDPQLLRYDSGKSIYNIQRIANLAGKQKIKFKPSAAAIHPLTGEIFIISSINLLLVVADRSGVVKQIYRLDRGTFKQPEGMAFTPQGDLIISNEAAGEGVANLLIFKYSKNVYQKK